jgi:hypothetical protein
MLVRRFAVMPTRDQDTAMGDVYSLHEQRQRIEAHNRLRERARERAEELRTQAIASFWVDADAWIRDAAHRAQRAADRLGARLRQHAKRRSAASGALDL